MKNTFKFALVGALLSIAAPVASAADCYKVSKQAAKEITEKPSQVLAIVAKQVAANKDCACSIVKAAIVATEADKKQVAQIVEQAISVVPDKVSLLTTCAIAVAPDSHVEVMKVAAKFSKNTGVASADGAKSGAKDGKAGVYEEDDKPYAPPLNFVGNGTANVYSQQPLNLAPTNGGGPVGQVGPGDPYNEPKADQ